MSKEHHEDGIERAEKRIAFLYRILFGIVITAVIYFNC